MAHANCTMIFVPMSLLYKHFTNTVDATYLRKNCFALYRRHRDALFRSIISYKYEWRLEEGNRVILQDKHRRYKRKHCVQYKNFPYCVLFWHPLLRTVVLVFLYFVHFQIQAIVPILNILSQTAPDVGKWKMFLRYILRKNHFWGHYWIPCVAALT